MIFASFAFAIACAALAAFVSLFGVRKIVSGHMSRLKCQRVKKYISRELVLAGRDGTASCDDVMSDSALLFLTFFAAGYFAGGLSFAVLAGFLCGVWPLLSLRARAKRFQCEIEKKLPDMIEMVRFLVEAGLSLRNAIVRVAQRCDFGALSDCLERVVSQLNAGRTLEESVSELASRSDLSEVASFVTLVKNSSRLGVSVAQNLELLSKKIRTLRYQRLERRGHQASQQLLVPIVFLIMPANFVVIFGPLLLNFIKMWR